MLKEDDLLQSAVFFIQAFRQPKIGINDLLRIEMSQIEGKQV